jgi:type IV fimbrial biogenesis protein FimT
MSQPASALAIAEPSTVARRGRGRRQQGISVIESLIALSVAAVVLGATVPGFEAARDRRQVEGAAAQLRTDLQHARSLSVAHDVGVRMSFARDQAGACYVVHTGPAGACSCNPGSGGASCSGTAEILRTAHHATGSGLRLEANVASIGFDAGRGTITPTATVRVLGQTAAVHQVINIMGRVRSCSPAPTLAGYKPC